MSSVCRRMAVAVRPIICAISESRLFLSTCVRAFAARSAYWANAWASFLTSSGSPGTGSSWMPKTRKSVLRPMVSPRGRRVAGHTGAPPGSIGRAARVVLLLLADLLADLLAEGCRIASRLPARLPAGLLRGRGVSR
jgi:hypothetical protein